MAYDVKSVNTTLCYLRRGEDYLMLHRVKKQNDVNQDKWIGVGGKFEADESPEDCLLREVREETGLNLTRYQYRGIVTFVSERWVTEYMHLFTADGWTGEIGECSEGVLEWVPRSRLLELPHWEGDAIFLDLLARDVPFFSLKLRYDKDDQLVEAVLNGEKIRSTETSGAPGKISGAPLVAYCQILNFMLYYPRRMDMRWRCQ